MVAPLDEFMSKKANDYMAVVDTWRPQTRQFKETYDEYKRWVGAPNGTEWTGRTSNAAYDTASTDCHGSDNTDDAAEDGGKLVAATIQYEVVEPLVNGQRLIESVLAHKDQGVSIDQNYNMAYHPAEGESDESIARNREHVADIERQVKGYVAQWDKGCQTLKAQADAIAQKITGCINPKTALVDGRKILRDAVAPTAGDPNATTVNYKEMYPKATDPATTQAAAATATDPHAPVLGPPSPGNKPPVDPSRLGGLTGNLGVMGINEPKSPLDKPPPPPDARTMPAPKLDPNTPQGKAAIDKFRSTLSTQYPPDQVEAKLSEAIKGAQQDRPMVATPEPGPPPERARESFSEAFHNSWDRGVKGVQDMVGANGLGEFKDAWGDAGTGLKNSFGELAHPTEISPERIDNAHRLIDNPKAFLGEQSAIAAQAVPGLILGGEGAAVRAGLPAELITEGGAPRALLQDWNATGGIPWKDFETQYGTPETRVYPGNDGFPPGYTPQPAQLPPGTIIDRFGHEGGRYLAPDGASFTDRALAPEAVGGAYNRYMVTGHPLPPGWQIVEGPVQPFYGQTPSPGATQYMIVGPDGVKPSVEELIREGILTREGPPLGR
ncbi:polymorphic toxin protein [Mycobacterium phage prophiGD21-3]|nr:polymorphic toxin protein [Mycobacterium phage prophiGD21-3]